MEGPGTSVVHTSLAEQKIPPLKWLSFVVVGVIGILFSVPIFKFPNSFPNSEKILQERDENRINFDSGWFSRLQSGLRGRLSSSTKA